jgi:hypothetical protein
LPLHFALPDLGVTAAALELVEAAEWRQPMVRSLVDLLLFLLRSFSGRYTLADRADFVARPVEDLVCNLRSHLGLSVAQMVRVLAPKTCRRPRHEPSLRSGSALSEPTASNASSSAPDLS